MMLFNIVGLVRVESVTPSNAIIPLHVRLKVDDESRNLAPMLTRSNNQQV